MRTDAGAIASAEVADTFAGLDHRGKLWSSRTWLGFIICTGDMTGSAKDAAAAPGSRKCLLLLLLPVLLLPYCSFCCKLLIASTSSSSRAPNRKIRMAKTNPCSADCS